MPNELEIRNSDPMSILASAVDAGRDPATLQALMDLAERYHANQAKAAYYAALKQFKDNAPRIVKNASGHNNARYTSLDHACAEVIPVLSRFGLSHRWITKVADGKISVTCVLSHEMGYSDPTPPQMEAGADTSGNKNAIQALGSTVKYLERYTFFAAIGLDDGSKDDDGASSGEAISQNEGADWIAKIEEALTPAEAMESWTKAMAPAIHINDYKAQTIYTAARDKRLKELKRGSR